MTKRTVHQERRRTIYGITDRRAIVVVRGWRTVIQSFSPLHLQALQRTEKADGSGDVLFAPGNLPGFTDRRALFGDSASTAATYGASFFGVENVREVEALLASLAAAAQVPKP